MAKAIALTVLGLMLLVAAIAGIKAMQIRQMLDPSAQPTPPPETVTTVTVRADAWESVLTAVGSVAAVQGVTVAAELPGRVAQIGFEAGMAIRAGDLLIQQDVSAEQAQLPGADAALELARKNFDRAGELLAKEIISRAEHDAAAAALKQAVGQAESLRAAMRRKTIRAPFDGRLGIRLVNLGQILSTGDPIVSLQTLDPVFVNFLLPQQALAQVRPGLIVRVTGDAAPGQVIEGKITATNAEVEAATRNIRIQATLANPRESLRPGMFVQVAVVLPGRQPVLAMPTTAVLYAPYGDSVFVVAPHTDEKSGRSGQVLRQQFVRLGEKRGDFVAVVSGLKAGETVVSTGVFKLRNGQAVVVDNALAPQFRLAPKPADE